MKYIIQKDEMGVVNYFNLKKELVMQVYEMVDNVISLCYENNKIVKIKARNLKMDLDLNGNILTVDFNNGVTAYFANKHQKIVFLDHDGEYLGSLNMNLEPIYSNSRIYIVNKIINKLNEVMPILIANRYANSMENVQDEIRDVNDDMVLDAVTILTDDNRHSIEKILKDYRKQEIITKRFLSLRKSKLTKEQYNQKYLEITKKYIEKRNKLKMRYGYIEEKRKLEDVQRHFIANQNKLNKLLLKKEDIYNEYLTR